VLTAHALGPLAVQTDTTAEVVLGGRLARRFAAVLVLRGDAAASDDSLVEAIWGEFAPPQAAASLQAYASRLRAALGVERDRLERIGDGYRLRLDDSDIRNFERIATAARGELERDPHRALRLAEEALALWRGEPLPELVDAGIVTAERARLLELQQMAVETMLEARLRTGDAVGTVSRAQQATENAPYREHRWVLLVLALYRSGRQAEAMGALARVKRLLAEELGIDPGTELKELERQVLTADPALFPSVESFSSLMRAPDVTEATTSAVGRLPRPRTSFHGRREELADVGARLSGGDSVTIVGPGGVGKTRLALEWAMRAQDGAEVWFVPLADIRRPEEVGDFIARGIGLAGVSEDPAEDVVTALSGRRGVLILDNCEHLLRPVARIVAELTSRLADVRVLATSREPLGIDGETVVGLVPLVVRLGGDDGPAMELLIDRIRAVRRGWEPSAEDRAQLRRLCEMVEGLPLAVELAAARARTLSITEITDRLDGRFVSLGDVPTGSPARHVNLSATIGWSVDSLASEDLALLRRLRPFEGGFDIGLALAASPGRDEAHVLGALSSLVSKSLVFADTSGTTTRYRIWETIRLYVREHDPAPPEHDEGCVRAIRGLVASASRTFGTPRSRYAMEQLDRDLANIRLMLDHDLVSEPEGALHALTSIEWFWFRAGLIAEGIRRATGCLEAAPNADPIDRSSAHGLVGVLSGIAGDLAAASAAFDAADALLTGADARSWYAGQLVYLRAILLTVTGHLDDAERCARSAVEIGRATGSALVQANGLMQLGVICFRRGRSDDGSGFLRTAAGLTVDGSPWTAGMAALHLTRERIAADLNDASDEAAIGRAIRIFRDERDLNTLATSLLVAADLAAAGGRTDFAGRMRALVAQAAHELHLPVDALNAASIAERSLAADDTTSFSDGRQRLREAAELWLDEGAAEPG
jgi:predicted ATPase/DNA-binding SARP family transcriptional activator